MQALLMPAALGLVFGLATPHGALLKASQELIAFVSLLMAGLLPAMTLTATVLRGDAFSATRVRDYGTRLSRQLRFWGALFGMAAVAVLLVTLAKVLDGTDGKIVLPQPLHMTLTLGLASQAACGFAMAAFFVMLSRLWPAYLSLQSLLTLTVRMAEVQALANDRALSDGLAAKATRTRTAFKESEQQEWPAEG